jgi:lipoate-protein ligase A
MSEARDGRLVRVPGLLIRQTGPAADDLERSVELLRGVASGEIAEQRVLRLYTPVATLAMTRRESRMPGFATAAEAAVRLGFAPAIRPTGGRAVAYDESCLVFDLISRDDATLDPSDYFAHAGSSIADALGSVGVDARLGEVAGEYCPGEYSINARGVVKLVGTSQRAIRGARMLSGMIAFGSVDRLVAVLAEANAALELEWDQATFGTMLVEAPGVSRAAVGDELAAALLG